MIFFTHFKRSSDIVTLTSRESEFVDFSFPVTYHESVKEMDRMENFGTIIKRKREYYGWTQKELADKLFVSDKSVSRWENNKGYPDITLLPAIAETLHLDYEELLNGNVYLAKRTKKRRKAFLTILGILAVFAIVFTVSLLSRPKEEKLSFREHLVQKGFGTYLFVDNIFYQLDQQQQDAILDFLDIDQWKSIPNHKEESGKQEWDIHYNIQDDSYIMKYVSTDTMNYITISNSTNTMTYRIDHSIGSITAYLKHEMQNWYNFDDSHQIHSNLQEVSIQKEKDLLYEYGISKHDLITHEAVLIEDTTYHRYYLIVSSHTMDYQRIVDDGKTIAISGNAYGYKTPYVHVFQLTEKDVLKKITINNEPIDVFALLHLSYPAKTS